MFVPGMRAAAVIGFFLHADDASYRAWWPDVHLAMHALEGEPGLGQVVWMDEYVGTRRLKFACVVTDLGADRITWQFRTLVRLPAWLDLQIVDSDGGATITHTIRAGFDGALGRALDPLLRLYFSERFEQMMDEHFRTEFMALPALLDA
jgi:hypothetical protein